MDSIDIFKETKECIYKGEHYSVRDNGAVMRHAREGKRIRKLDNIWTFGSITESGYLTIASERIHRIVATAFHGEAPSPDYVVDHIDTNRQNNRPDNLRWLTKLENILNNDITRHKIEYICGSVEEFLKNPSLLAGYESDFSWMRIVTPEEAKNCLDNWNNWIRSSSIISNRKIIRKRVNEDIYKTPTRVKRNDNSTIYDSNKKSLSTYSHQIIEEDTDEDINENNIHKYWFDSLTLSAKQSWQTPTIFPCCPTDVKEYALEQYKINLKEKKLFSSNTDDNYYVLDCNFSPDKKSLLILCSNNDTEQTFGKYALCRVVVMQNYFFHISLKRFGNIERAVRLFKLKTGEEQWTEDDMIVYDT